MRKIVSFIIIIILLVLIIIFSYNYYSKKEKLNRSRLLDSNEKIEGIIEKKKDDSKIKKQEEKVKKEDKENNNLKKEETVVVPDTSSNDNSGYVEVEKFVVSANKNVISINETTDILVKVYPENASVKDFYFGSFDDKICKVSSLGKVTAINKGICIIDVSMKNSKKSSVIINIK